MSFPIYIYIYWRGGNLPAFPLLPFALVAVSRGLFEQQNVAITRRTLCGEGDEAVQVTRTDVFVHFLRIFPPFTYYLLSLFLVRFLHFLLTFPSFSSSFSSFFPLLFLPFLLTFPPFSSYFPSLSLFFLLLLQERLLYGKDPVFSFLKLGLRPSRAVLGRPGRQRTRRVCAKAKFPPKTAEIRLTCKRAQN